MPHFCVICGKELTGESGFPHICSEECQTRLLQLIAQGGGPSSLGCCSVCCSLFLPGPDWNMICSDRCQKRRIEKTSGDKRGWLCGHCGKPRPANRWYSHTCSGDCTWKRSIRRTDCLSFIKSLENASIREMKPPPELLIKRCVVCKESFDTFSEKRILCHKPACKQKRAVWLMARARRRAETRDPRYAHKTSCGWCRKDMVIYPTQINICEDPECQRKHREYRREQYRKAHPSPPRQCRVCGADFLLRESRHRVICKRCFDNQTDPLKLCQVCGNPFRFSESRHRFHCTDLCYNREQAPKTRLRNRLKSRQHAEMVRMVKVRKKLLGITTAVSAGVSLLSVRAKSE